MTHIGNLTQQAHHLTPARTMTAWAIVSKISQDMRAFVDKCRISIALSALLQQPGIQYDTALIRIGSAGKGSGTATDNNHTIKHFTKGRVELRSPRQTRCQSPPFCRFANRADLAMSLCERVSGQSKSPFRLAWDGAA